MMQYIKLEKNYTVADFADGNAPMLNFLGRKVKNYFGVDFSLNSFVKKAMKF